MVAVQFVGTDNKELPIDARDLFGVKDGEVVVIRGVASFNAKLALPIIQLQADGIYIRKGRISNLKNKRPFRTLRLRSGR